MFQSCGILENELFFYAKFRNIQESKPLKWLLISFGMAGQVLKALV